MIFFLFLLSADVCFLKVNNLINVNDYVMIAKLVANSFNERKTVSDMCSFFSPNNR